MKIGDYFSGIERSLRRVKGAEIQGEVTCLASDDYNGLVRCRVLFWEESYLDVYEVVSTELGYPVKVHYGYTFMQDSKRIFRYDNALIKVIDTTNGLYGSCNYQLCPTGHTVFCIR